MEPAVRGAGGEGEVKGRGRGVCGGGRGLGEPAARRAGGEVQLQVFLARKEEAALVVACAWL